MALAETNFTRIVHPHYEMQRNKQYTFRPWPSRGVLKVCVSSLPRLKHPLQAKLRLTY
jgi:hypothetical protein